MNYRHAFHAGNFADVMKHALLVLLLRLLQRGPGPIYVLDTHAGAGMYSLDSPEAQRSGEWRDGIGRLALATDTSLADYRRAIVAANPDRPLARYPGSPWLVQHLLRPADRLVACESESGPAAELAAVLGADSRVQVRTGDGWRALRTFLPPRERRGLVLIDPPFERREEHGRLGRALADAHRQWPGGTLAGWYPLKRGAAVDELYRAAPPQTESVELSIRGEDPSGRLHGSGLALVNPPPGFRAAATALLDALVPHLAAGPGAGWRGHVAPLGRTGEAALSSSSEKQEQRKTPHAEDPRARHPHDPDARRRPQADGRKPRPRLPRQA